MMKSTMNAPLSESEEARIVYKWCDLRDLCHNAVSREVPADPVKMLDICTDLVGAIWELRRAIDDGWHGANKRAFPSPEPVKKKHMADYILNAKIDKVLDDLKTAGFTDEDIITAMKESQK